MQAILLDIEGTTTPNEFVTQALFPYARQNVRSFLEHRYPSEDILLDVDLLRKEHALDQKQHLEPPAWHEETREGLIASVTAYVYFLMDRDRKSTGLKSLQGKIWELGYRSGKLHSEVYPDVVATFSRWHAQKKRIYIYSSGSVLAQKLLFGHTSAGDLMRFVDGYFDTMMGAKNQPDSYRRIADYLGREPSEILFVSDAVIELDAAQAAGLRTLWCVRSGEPPHPTPAHPVIQSFEEIMV